MRNFDDSGMDLTPFKLDIDELLDEFTKGNYTTLADMKRVWMSKKFSFIFEAKPKLNEALFMQSLFSYSIKHMVSANEISRRLGGLYCLYCLYETQPYQPAFKIYLSLSQLKSLKVLVVDAKKMDISVVPALVKRMLDKGMFLFGSVDIVGGCQKVDEVMKLENKRVQIAYEKLLGDTHIEHYVHMDLGTELGIDTHKKMFQEYAEAKQLALSEETGNSVGTDVVEYNMEDNNLVGNRLKDIVKEWNAQKDTFYKQTGLCHGNELVEVDGFDELECLLNQ